MQQGYPSDTLRIFNENQKAWSILKDVWLRKICFEKIHYGLLFLLLTLKKYENTRFAKYIAIDVI